MLSRASRRPLLSLLAALLMAAPLAAGAPPVGGVDHERAAENFLARHGHPGAAPEDLTMVQLVEEECASVSVGAVELLIPRRTFGTPSERERFRGLCAEVLAAQELWLSWVAPAVERDKQLEKDLKAVAGWIARRA